MVTDELLDQYRMESIEVRIVRDADESNDVKGYVMAWDKDTVLIKKRNRRVVKLPRSYKIKPLSVPRE